MASVPPTAGGESTPLLPRHRERLVHGSAIAPDVLAERGYHSVAAADPRLALFADYQRADGILIPLFPPDGSNGRYTLRRDRDRVKTDPETGKPKRAKYEQPAGQAHRLDVHPRNRTALADPTIPLWVTEGIFKNDALTSAGRCSVGLGGVWCFRKECLPDWDLIALLGRTVVIVFDSDAETNPNVAQARDALATFLAGRGARVRIVRLPAGPNGEKVGIDDYLGAGGDLVDLLACHAEDWRPPDEGACPRDDCRTVRRELAEQRETASLEARILTAAKGAGLAPNRRVPALLLGRRYFSDTGRDRLQPERTPVVDADGWDRIPLQRMADDTGIGYSALLATRKELVASGVLEERRRDVLLSNGRRVEVTDVRPTVTSLKEWVGQLATVVQAPTGWGGKRYRCPNRCKGRILVKHVCSLCGAEAVAVEAGADTEAPAQESGIGFQLENRCETLDAPEESVSPGSPHTYSDDFSNRSADVPDRPMTTDEVRDGVDDLIARRIGFQLENRSVTTAPSPPTRAAEAAWACPFCPSETWTVDPWGTACTGCGREGPSGVAVPIPRGSPGTVRSLAPGVVETVRAGPNGVAETAIMRDPSLPPVDKSITARRACCGNGIIHQRGGRWTCADCGREVTG